ncbi:hypothetical protein [Brevundimonas subvibrioides]|uniref:Bacteriophage tail tape measure N-terminal domain-containing protein n=1 Tax=Brevundimonas subvibrioides (strain ATCC 15264 / DSM 4735 / LMG 14903 / NBRC 16000 / CB 81) TaxID=633149 RepID=D9QFY8_BRESC|nr:hypothetical protein [Brevundimonas subvibrioides]ADL00702.1 hypothetical protein Bresu_1390 [Brevundimonas subvibrioides ATCC 15264]
MTDASGGKSGVGIRLFVQGGEVVRRTFDQVADSGKKMWAQIALGDRAANPAIRALSVGVGEAKSGIRGLASETGSAGAVLGAFGAAGVAVGAVLGAVAIAATGAFQAMRDAADLTDQADRIGVNAEALQEWRFAAEDAGVSAGSLDAGLEKLNGVLGAFKLGIGDAKLRPVFEELGITAEQLANVETSDQLLDRLADTLGQVRDRTEQVKLSRSLGIEELLPLLRLGSDGIADLRDRSRELGIVLDDEVRAQLDAADRQMEITGQQMDTLRLVSLSPLAEALGDAAASVTALIVEFGKVEADAPGWVRALQSVGGALASSIRQTAFNAGGLTGTVAGIVTGGGRRGAAPAPVSISSETFLAGLRQSDTRPGFETQGHTTRSGSTSRSTAAAQAARAAEQRQRERERALSDLQRQELDAQRDRIRARFGPGGTEENAANLELANIEIAQAAQEAARGALRASLEKAGALDEIVEVRLNELKDAQDELAANRDRAVILEERRRLAAERLKDEQSADQSAIDLLSIQEQMATTARERFEIGRRILLAEQALERATLAAEAKVDGKVTGYERNGLARLDQRQAAEVALFDVNEQNRLREQFKDYGREVVDAIQDGRIGEYIGDQLKQRLLDGALDALFNMMGGAGSGQGSGGGGYLSAAISFGKTLFGGGRAAGGSLQSGYRYGMAEHGPELALFGTGGQVFNARDTAAMLQGMGDGGTGAGSTTVHQHHYHNDFAGAVTTAEFMAGMDARANRARQEAVAQATDIARRSAPGLQGRQRRLGTT